MQWIKRITNTVYPCRDAQAHMSPWATIRQGNGQTVARPSANLTALLHSCKFPMSYYIMVISRHYYHATETKNHICTNFRLPPTDYKHFHSKVVFLMLDPHFSSSFTPKPRPPQPQLRKIPHVFHSSQPPSHMMSLPPCFPNLDYLQTTPVISPQDLLFFFLSAQPHVLHTRSQTGSFPLTPGLAIPAEAEAEEGDGTGREASRPWQRTLPRPRRGSASPRRGPRAGRAAPSTTPATPGRPPWRRPGRDGTGRDEAK